MILAVSSVQSGALDYAFALGLVGAANPCGLPLLPAYLSFFADEPGSGSRRPVQALGAAAAVTAGFAAVFGVLGLVFGAVVASIEVAIPWLMVGLGAVMALIGLAGLAGRPLKVPLPRARLGGRRPVAMFSFGVVYGLASLGCALPVFLAAVGGNLDHPAVFAMVRSSLAYALGMGLLLAVLALAASTVRRAIVRMVRPAARAGQLIAATLLVLSGSYVAYYWATSLADPRSAPPLVTGVNNAQAAVSAWMAGNARWLGLAFGLAVVGVLLSASLTSSPPASVATGRPLAAAEKRGRSDG